MWRSYNQNLLKKAPLSSTLGGGGLYSTTSDYRMLLSNGVLNDQQILSAEMVDKMFDNHSAIMKFN